MPVSSMAARGARSRGSPRRGQVRRRAARSGIVDRGRGPERGSRRHRRHSTGRVPTFRSRCGVGIGIHSVFTGLPTALAAARRSACSTTDPATLISENERDRRDHALPRLRENRPAGECRSPRRPPPTARPRRGRRRRSAGTSSAPAPPRAAPESARRERAATAAACAIRARRSTRGSAASAAVRCSSRSHRTRDRSPSPARRSTA